FALGPHDPTARLRISVALPLRDPEGLDAFLKALYDPHDPLYRRFITPQEFADRFGPTAAQYQELQDHLRGLGLRVPTTYANRMLVAVEGGTAQVEKAFGVKINDLRRPDGSVFFGPDRDPSWAGDDPVLRVAGLDNSARPRPRSHHLPPGSVPRTGGSGPIV